MENSEAYMYYVPDGTPSVQHNDSLAIADVLNMPSLADQSAVIDGTSLPDPSTLDAPSDDFNHHNYDSQEQLVPTSQFVSSKADPVLTGDNHDQFDENCIMETQESQTGILTQSAAGSCFTPDEEMKPWTETERVESPEHAETSSCHNQQDSVQQVVVGAKTTDVDFGETLALDDFGGGFDETAVVTDVDIFVDNKPAAKSDSEVTVSKTAANVVKLKDNTEVETECQLPKLQAAGSEIVTKITEVGHDVTDEAEEIPVLEPEIVRQYTPVTGLGEDTVRQDIDKASKSLSKKSNPGQTASNSSETKESPSAELNVNSRPRRSIARKSVFELLQVEYRPSGGQKRHLPTHVDVDVDGEHESAPLRKHPPKKTAPKTSTPKVGKLEESSTYNSEKWDHQFRKVTDKSRNTTTPDRQVCYAPDDFETECKSDGKMNGAGDKDSHLHLANHHRSDGNISAGDVLCLSAVIDTSEEDRAARTFAAEFEAASAEVLASDKLSSSDDPTKKSVDELLMENNDLRARIKALEQSKNSVRKFNIDFHSRKFSRVRSPLAVGADDRKTCLKVAVPLTANSIPSTQSIHSRAAMLDRRENKLRELSAELDERTNVLRAGEGALQRRERKLLDFEKTLEYRERVLNRHEHNAQKRELEAELAGSDSLADSTELSGDKHSLVAEMHRKMEQRRLELERRQAFLDAEREKLAARERELDQREQELLLKLRHSQTASSQKAEDSLSEDENNSAETRVTDTVSTKKKKAPRCSSQSDTLSAKKKKLQRLNLSSTGLSTNKKALKPLSTSVAKNLLKKRITSSSVSQTVGKESTTSVSDSTRKKYGLRKHSL